MAKSGGRLQAETGRMLRAALLLFGVAWFGLLLLPGHPHGPIGLYFALPGGALNLTALTYLALAYTRAWGTNTEDARSPGKTRRYLVAGTWFLLMAVVAYAAGLILVVML